MSFHSEYSQEDDFAVKDLRLRYEGGIYRGRGIVKWNPSEGFDIEAFLERFGDPLPEIIEIGKVGIIERRRFTSIRMKPDGFQWGYIRPIPLFDRMDILHSKRLSLLVPSMLFGRRLPVELCSGEYTGELLLRSPHWDDGTDQVESETRLNGRRVETRYSRGIAHESKDFELIGRWDDSKNLRLSWSLPPTSFNRPLCKIMGRAIADAMSLLCGAEAQILQQSFRHGKSEIIERSFCEKPRSLKVFRLVHGDHFLDKDRLIRLIGFFQKKSLEVNIARNIMSTCLDAIDQRTMLACDFLIASCLEGALRTLYSLPMGETRKTDRFDIAKQLAQFRTDYLSNEWRKICKRAIGAFRRMRHRNAHPDWLTTPHGSLSDAKRRESLDDRIFMTAFLGHMILAMAKLPDLKPRFPVPHEKWGPTITITHQPKATDSKEP